MRIGTHASVPHLVRAGTIVPQLAPSLQINWYQWISAGTI